MSKIRTIVVLFFLSVLSLSFGCKAREDRKAAPSIPQLKSIVKSQKTVYRYGEPVDITYEITNDNVFTVTVALKAIKTKLLNGSLSKFTPGRTDQVRENVKGKSPENDIFPAKGVTGKGELGIFRLTPGKWKVWTVWQYDLRRKYPASKQFPYIQESSPVELEVLPLDPAGYALLADAINDSNIPIEDRIQLITAIPDLPQASFFVPKLIEALNDSNYKVWVTASRILGFIGDARAVPPLISGLTERKNACFIMALGDMKATAAIPYLIDLLKKIENNQIQPDAKDAKIQILIVIDHALSQITGQPSANNLDATPEKTGELIQKWSEWWEKNKKPGTTEDTEKHRERQKKN